MGGSIRQICARGAPLEEADLKRRAVVVEEGLGNRPLAGEPPVEQCPPKPLEIHELSRCLGVHRRLKQGCRFAEERAELARVNQRIAIRSAERKRDKSRVANPAMVVLVVNAENG